MKQFTVEADFTPGDLVRVYWDRREFEAHIYSVNAGIGGSVYYTLIELPEGRRLHNFVPAEVMQQVAVMPT
jgi:hypothetical protein